MGIQTACWAQHCFSHDISTQWLKSSLRLLFIVRVPTLNAMTALFPTWEDLLQVLLGPYVEQDLETEVVTRLHCHHLQLVLLVGCLMGILVHRQRFRTKHG